MDTLNVPEWRVKVFNNEQMSHDSDNKEVLLSDDLRNAAAALTSLSLSPALSTSSVTSDFSEHAKSGKIKWRLNW